MLFTGVTSYWNDWRYIMKICPPAGDTSFLAYKLGGEMSAFGYYNSDSLKYVPYQDIFPPFDTTELEFLY